MKLVSRAQWGARPAKRQGSASMSDASTAHWNGPTVKIAGRVTWGHEWCASIVRGIQNFHMDGRGWADIAYNFIPCPHGYVFEGRGLNTTNGANGTNAGNRSSHAVMCLAGDDNPFSDAEKQGFRECVAYISKHTAAPNRCKGHRDHKATACPGDARYNWVHAGMPVAGGAPATPTDPNNRPGSKTPTLKLGTSGNAVRHVQTIIRDKAGGDIKVDGMYGPHTKSRVRDVQRFFGLTADGIVGVKTWGLLRWIESLEPATENNADPQPEGHPYDGWPGKEKPMIKEGARGGVVQYLQRVIHDKAGGEIEVDSNFGPQTKRRVQDFQRFFKMNDDGIVGPKTWGMIDFVATA